MIYIYFLIIFITKQEIDAIRHCKAKKPVVLPRSDSIGSGSGRKYLIPTLSDPASIRSEKDKSAAPKKKNNRPPRMYTFILCIHILFIVFLQRELSI